GSTSFSPDGKLVVTASEDKTARVWDWRANRMLLELPHPEAVSGARFSDDGAAVITMGDDNAARVWDAKTGRRLSPVLYGVVAKVGRGPKEVTIKAYNPDGRHIFFVSAQDEDEKNLPKKSSMILPGVRESVWDVRAGRVLPGLEELRPVSGADFNVGQKIMVTDGMTLWDLGTGRRFATLRGEEANGVALSPDAALVVTAHNDNAARVWKVPESRDDGANKKEGEQGEGDERSEGGEQGEGQVVNAPLWTLTGHRGPVRSAVFSPDGRFILTTSDDRTARVWDVKTGVEVSVLRGHRKGLLSASFSPDGNLMVTSGDDGTARIWDRGMGQGFVELGKAGEVKDALFGARSNLILVSDDRTARIWDVSTRKSLPHVWSAHIAALGPEGKFIVTAKQEATRIYEAATGRVRVELPAHDGETLSAAYSPDGRFVATAGRDKVVRVRDVETGKIDELPVEMKDIARLIFSPAGDLLLMLGVNNAKLWEWKTKRPPLDLSGYSGIGSFVGEMSGGVFSPDGRLVAGQGGAGVALWDARTGCRTKIQLRHRSPVHNVIFSRDGRSLLSTDSYAARLWQLPATLKCEGKEETLEISLELDQTKAESFPKRNALISPDGRFIVLMALRHGFAQVLDASTGELKFKLDDGSIRTHGAALSSDGRLIVTACEDGKARVWDSGTGSLLRTLEGNSAIPLSAASFSPDDKLIVTVSDPRFNAITVWDAVTGQRVGETLRGRSAAFSPDGKSVLTLSGGDVARVSGVSDGSAVAELQGLTGTVTQLAFSDDGRRIAAATSDRKVGVWETATGRSLARHEYAGDITRFILSRDGKRI
ncbi:MAG TPA: WD40 repeat domain-containing protein, partial [Pyrinomonadaceae bacterium]